MEASVQNIAGDDKSWTAAVRLRRPERSQVVMKVECPDDLIPADHSARRVWAVVESLDLSAFCRPIKARAGVCGRDATDPRLLVALWLYACVRGIGSARELARRCDAAADGARPFLWLCGGVSINHHTLSDFRVAHGAALDELFTRTIAVLVKKGLVKVRRISQDGTRARACAGAASFRRGSTLAVLLAEAKTHVEELKALLEDPKRSAGLSSRQKAARTRGARERQERLERAIKTIPQLEAKQEKLAKRMSKKEQAKKLKEPRASATDAEARVMKMPNGGFNPAVNVQLAVDTDSRAIVGVDVSGSGADAGQSEPMREQVEQRTGLNVEEHLIDGGYLVNEEIERAAAAGVTLYVPPKSPRKREKFGSEYEPRAADSQVINDWRQRMGSPQGKQIYKQRAATVETANANLKQHGLVQMTVRGLKKARCIALWCALAYNLTLLGGALIG
jgi:transposase